MLWPPIKPDMEVCIITQTTQYGRCTWVSACINKINNCNALSHTHVYICSLANIGVKLGVEQAEKIHDQLGIVFSMQAKIRAFPSRAHLNVD